MRTAVSIADEIYERAERLARQTKKSRSRLFSEALAEYIARHAPDEITESMNQVCDVGGLSDPFVSSSANQLLRKLDW
jgi:predicted transcriptional regulator